MSSIFPRSLAEISDRHEGVLDLARSMSSIPSSSFIFLGHQVFAHFTAHFSLIGPYSWGHVRQGLRICFDRLRPPF